MINIKNSSKVFNFKNFIQISQIFAKFFIWFADWVTKKKCLVVKDYYKRKFSQGKETNLSEK